MGASKSKVRELSPKTLHDLQRNVDVDFTREEIEEWFLEYQSSLGQGQTKLTEKEFRVIYNSVFDGDSEDFVRHLFRSFDANGDGYVDFKEFIVGLCVSGSDLIDTKLKWAFRMYDVDGNGLITKEEMSGMLKAIYRMVATDPRTAEDDMKTMEDIIAEFFESADRNHDNAISREEFVDGVKAMPVVLHLLQCDPDPEAQEEQFVAEFDALEVAANSRKASAASPDKAKKTPVASTSGASAHASERSKSYKAKQKT